MTGEPLPDELRARLVDQAPAFGEGFATTEYLAAALLDLAWHRLAPGEEVADVEAFEAAALAAAGIPAQCPRATAAPTSTTSSPAAYCAAYYSYIWSEVLDADTVEWFAEHGGLRRENGERVPRARCCRAAAPSTRWRPTAPSAAATRRSARCWPVAALRADRRGAAADAAGSAATAVVSRLQEAQQLHREGQDQRGVLLRGHLHHGLQQPQLERRRAARDIAAAACASFFDACSSASALMTRARRSRSASACRAIERFIVSGSETSLISTRSIVHAPAHRGAVDHQLQALVELLAVGEQVVQLALADDRAQRGLRHLRDREPVVLDVDDRARPGRRP